MILARAKDLTWNSDRSFKPAYFAGNDVLEVAHEGYKMYIDENALYGKTSYPVFIDTKLKSSRCWLTF